MNLRGKRVEQEFTSFACIQNYTANAKTQVYFSTTLLAKMQMNVPRKIYVLSFVVELEVGEEVNAVIVKLVTEGLKS